MLVPTKKTTSPPISGGSSGLIRRRIGASADWIMPANTVMPKTSGRPPSFKATSDGSRKIPVWHDGQRNPQPTGPLGKDCSIEAIPNANRARLSKFTDAAVGSAAI